MSKEVNNFEVISSMMKFNTKKDFYIVEAVCRPKKDGTSTLSGTANNHTRVIRLWTFYSVDDFLNKKDEIVNVCNTNNARAYFLPQKRNTYVVLKNMMENVLKNLDSDKINFNRMISSTLCGCHDVADSHDKRWVLDLDNDSMVERWIEVYFGGQKIMTRGWTFENVMSLVKGLIKETGDYSESEVYSLQTRNGWHIITPPFNLQKAQEQCSLMFEGEREMPEKLEEYTLNPGDKGCVGSIGLDKRYRVYRKSVAGWVKKDGMTLLYAASRQNEAK